MLSFLDEQRARRDAPQRGGPHSVCPLGVADDLTAVLALVPALALFNFGVEIGQIAIVSLETAPDSLLEEAGFEPSVPLYILTVSDPLLVGPVRVPFAKRKSSVGDRVPSVRRLLPPPSIPGHRLGALRWHVTGVA